MKPTKPKWEPCSPGVLQEAATESLGRRALLKVLVGCAVLIALGAGTAVGLILSDAKPEPAKGMSCLAVQDHLQKYMDESLPEEICGEVHAHLMKCNKCKAVYSNLVDCPSRPKKPTFKVCPCTGHCPCP